MVENLYAGFLNMDHRTDRLNHMEGQLSRVGLKAIRHLGKKPHEYNLDDPKYRVMLNRTPGAIACHEGQVDIMKTAQSMGQHALVMEDDIIFCEDFNKRIDYIDKWADSHDWDVIWLGASFHVNPCYWHPIGQSGMRPDCSAQLGKDCEPTDDPRMIRTYGAYVTFAYIVNYNSMDKIFKLFDEHLHTSIGIDWLFIKLQPQLKCYSFVPGCVMQMDNLSDIGNGMTVWSGQLNNGPYVFQKLMTDFNPETFKWI
jgi:GR25 family glycosyltransferase involved in LPS biosynthesis